MNLAMEVREYRLKTLTPIWTGSVGMKSDQVKTSGILGSLKQWYVEMGQKEPELFGSTAKSRRFRLEVSGLGAKSFTHWAVMPKPEGPRSARMLWSDDFVITCRFPTYVTEHPENGESYQSAVDRWSMELDKLMVYVVDYRGLGAKTAKGFGQVRFVGDRPTVTATNPVGLYFRQGKLPSVTSYSTTHLLLASKHLRDQLRSHAPSIYVAVYQTEDGQEMRCWSEESLEEQIAARLDAILQA